jgi:hypothetical protein
MSDEVARLAEDVPRRYRAHLWPNDAGRIMAAIDEWLATDVRAMRTKEVTTER